MPKPIGKEEPGVHRLVVLAEPDPNRSSPYGPYVSVADNPVLQGRISVAVQNDDGTTRIMTGSVSLSNNRLPTETFLRLQPHTRSTDDALPWPTLSNQPPIAYQCAKFWTYVAWGLALGAVTGLLINRLIDSRIP